MLREIPYSFSRAVKDYDGALHVVWCPSVHCYAVEREVHNRPPDLSNAIKSVHHRMANRPLPEGQGIEPEHLRKIRERRGKAQARLDAMNRGREVVLWFYDLEHDTLQAILYTLREDDLWSKFEVKVGETPDVAATKIATQIAYEEDYEERRLESKRSQTNREIAAEAYMPLVMRSGGGVAVTGVQQAGG